MKLIICAGLVAEEYQAARIDLPPMARQIEAFWAYDEMLSRMSDPKDGDEMEAIMPLLRHLLRKRLADRTGTKDQGRPVSAGTRQSPT